MLEATNIRKNYSNLQVLKGVNLKVDKGEVVTLIGSSGAGKSTLLHILGTLDQPDKGFVKIHDRTTSGLSNKQMASFRNENIGFVFQFHHLLPEFTALENICIPGWISGKVGKKEIQNRATDLLEQVGLAERIHHKPGELSGGEQQRVAVARALINRPHVVFADEPTGNLDSVNAKELHQLFLLLRERFQLTFIIATHNQKLAQMSDRQLQMKDGVLLN